MIALGMMDESRHITGGYVIDDFGVLTAALLTYMEYQKLCMIVTL